MIKPVGERVLIEPLADQERSNGGIYIPQNVSREQEYSEGIVRALGQIGATNRVKVGEHVLYPTHMGFTVNDPDGKTYRIVDEKEILAVV